MRFVHLGPFSVSTSTRRRPAPQNVPGRQSARQRRKAEEAGQEAWLHSTGPGSPRNISGPVGNYKLTENEGVSFTIQGMGRSLDVMMPDDPPEQFLTLHNGDVVRVILNDALTAIEDFELWYYPDGSKPKEP